MIQDLLIREEGKTLEFKENASSLAGIAKTVVAFANQIPIAQQGGDNEISS